jgi:hypothetical protein
MSRGESRAERAIMQQMFLMSALRTGDDWDFTVQGSRGVCYNVHFRADSLACTCPDFRKRGLVCKHTFFMAGRVLGDRALMGALGDDPAVAAATLFAAGFSARIETRLRARLQLLAERAPRDGRLDEEGAETDADCVVCFEPLVRTTAAWTCRECRQPCMHGGCAVRWFKQSPSCPLCRTPVAAAANNNTRDALANFTSFYE